MSYRDYIATTSATSDSILSEWRWLVPPELEVWLVTKWGDAILRHRSDGSIHLLDTLDGDLSRIADDEAAFEAALTSVEVQDEWLRAVLVDRQARHGMQPGPDQCLQPRVPPSLGGGIEAADLQLQLVTVHFAVAGQILRQVRSMALGKKVSGLRVVVDAPTKPWWKLW